MFRAFLSCLANGSRTFWMCTKSQNNGKITTFNFFAEKVPVYYISFPNPNEGHITEWLRMSNAYPSCCKTLSRLGLREEASRYTVGTSIQQSVRLSTWFLWLHRLCLFGSFRFISSQYILIFVTDLIEEKNKCIDSVAATWNLEYSQFTDGFREACTGWDV